MEMMKGGKKNKSSRSDRCGRESGDVSGVDTLGTAPDVPALAPVAPGSSRIAVLAPAGSCRDTQRSKESSLLNSNSAIPSLKSQISL